MKPHSRSILCAIAFVILLSSFASGARSVLAQTQYPLADDVASPEAIVTAAYLAIQRAPGDGYQWDRFRSLCIPQARLIPNTEQTGGQLAVLSPEEFIALADKNTVVGGANDAGFSEEELFNKVERYGDVAHVFSTYQKRFWNDDRILGRGINSFQLVRHNDRWWITGIVWDEESGAGPIPPKYMPQN